MPSEISIINSALIKIGCHDRIASLSETNSRCVLSKEQLPKLRREVLRSFAPRFSRVRVQLGLSTSTPSFDYDYQFPLPSGCLRILKTDLTTDWIREGNLILTSESECRIQYVSDISDYGLWDDDAAEVLATRLSADLSIPIAQNNTTQQTMMKAYEILLRGARHTSSTEGSGEKLEANDWINVRY